MHCFVTGAAGFIGSSLTDRLLALGHDVTGFDNFSTGRRQFLEDALRSSAFRLLEGDLLDRDAVRKAMVGADCVFHLAATADVRYGVHHPRRDLEQNTTATCNVLEAMRLNNVGRISPTRVLHERPELRPEGSETTLEPTGTPDSNRRPVLQSKLGRSGLRL